MRVKTERLYSWEEFHWMTRNMEVSYRAVAERWPYAYDDSGLYPASAARPIPLRPEDLQQAYRQGD
jgi:hypothetical protein